MTGIIHPHHQIPHILYSVCIPWVWCPVSLAAPGGWWGSAGTCFLRRENRVQHFPTKAIRTERALNNWMYWTYYLCSGFTELVTFTVDVLSFFTCTVDVLVPVYLYSGFTEPVYNVQWMYWVCWPGQWIYWAYLTVQCMYWCLCTCTVYVLVPVYL